MTDRAATVNAFDFLRLMAAFAVLFSHSFALYGLPEPTIIAGETFGSMAVNVFFAVSGFLVCQSWLRDPNVTRFVIRRTLRILPGLIVAVLFTAILVGGLATTLPLADYFTRSETWTYVLSQATIITDRPYLPGVFEHAPHRSANGSLWTLRYEISMYVLLAVIGMFFRTHFRAVCLAAFLSFLAIWVGYFTGPVSGFAHLAKWGTFFFAGASLHLLRAQASPWVAAALTGALVLAPTWLTRGMLVLAVPYISLAIARFAPDILKRKRPDLSYGVYIYAFPIQQLVSRFCVQHESGWTAAFVSASLITTCFASMSWHFVEAPALRLKERLTKREFTKAVPA